MVCDAIIRVFTFYIPSIPMCSIFYQTETTVWYYIPCNDPRTLWYMTMLSFLFAFCNCLFQLYGQPALASSCSDPPPNGGQSRGHRRNWGDAGQGPLDDGEAAVATVGCSSLTSSRSSRSTTSIPMPMCSPSARSWTRRWAWLPAMSHLAALWGPA
jgi:hypothetical protein